jgi:nitrogen fixation/metabolism regulation signal transduction histidine kinase
VGAVNKEIIEPFRSASKFFFKKYKEKGGSQGQLAKEFGVTQTYLSSVMNGSRSASFELYNQIADKLYGPLDKFIGAGRDIMEGRDPLETARNDEEDSIEKLMAQLTYYVMDYKRLQKELSRQKIFYESIIENLQSGVVVMDRNDRVIFANRHMEKMCGMRPESITGTTPYNDGDHATYLAMGFPVREYKKARKLLAPIFYEKVPTELPGKRVSYHSGWVIPQIKDDAFDGMICTLRDSNPARTAE